MNNIYKFLKNLTNSSKGDAFTLTAPPNPPDYPNVPEYIFPSYRKNLDTIKEIFHFSLNSDIKIREFETGGKKAFIVFVENLVNSDIVNTHILAPLMLIKNDATKESITNSLLVVNQFETVKKYSDAIYSINLGDCVIFVDDIDTAFICDVKNWERRGVEPPVSEAVIYGPHEGFNENYKTNGALIRKNIRSSDLICEGLQVGKISNTPCSMLYMKNIANQSLVDEVKNRINNIGADYIYQLGELEQFIEDKTFTLVPQFLTTERPDKASEALIEGKIVILLHGSPFALICPVTITEFFTTVEDKYIRFPYSNLIKIIRLLGIVASFLLPGLYIALTNFHQEVLPTDLLFAIAATREAVPFPALIELLLMEVSFDIIREASIRVPSSIGSTLGIIGALIVGQAAVDANIVSPITIIIVAITGIGSFAIPNYALNMSFRFLRYIYIFLGAVFGFFGIASGLFMHTLILCSTYSMGSTLISESFSKFLFNRPIYKREKRHKYLKPRQDVVQDKTSRKWMKK